jgi:proline-rich inner membrane protein
MPIAHAQELNEANVRTEYARWRKFHGISGRIENPAKTEEKARKEQEKAEAKAKREAERAAKKAAAEKAKAEKAAAEKAKAEAK